MSDTLPSAGSDSRAREALLARIESLEQSLRQIAREVVELRAELHGAAGGDARLPSAYTPPAPGSAPAAPDAATVGPTNVPAWARPRRSRPRTEWTAEEFESVVGRYGMLALATVAALAAVGTFLGWAIAHGLLSPPVRVLLGLVAAAALAVGGMLLRKRERSFGSTLLGLSLAVTHVCAYSSGPLLELVPSWAAFLLAAIASVALAVFAHREEDQPLWCVGFGGAALAPFVTSDGRGESWMLASYGVVVLVAGAWALRDRAWTIAERVHALGAALFTAALAAMPEDEGGPLLAVALPLVVGGAGILPFSPPERVRGRLRTLGTLAAVAVIRAAFQSTPIVSRPVLALVLGAAGMAWLILVDVTSALPALPPRDDAPYPRSSISLRQWTDVAWLPLVYVFAMIAAMETETDAIPWWALAVSSLVLVAFHARRSMGGLREGAAFAAALCAVAAALRAWPDSQELVTVSVVALSIAFCLVHLLRPSRTWIAAAILALLGSASATLGFLSERTPYEYAPFRTPASAVAIVVAIGWTGLAALAPTLLAGLRAAEARVDDRASGVRGLHWSDVGLGSLRGAARAAAIVWVFVWVNLEIAYAWSLTIATLLLITYYASTSVVSVGVGRRIGYAPLRRIGLGLGLLAAIVAFRGASSLDAVGARIAGYLVTAVFLLGIAWWYRKPGSEVAGTPPGDPASEATPA